MMLPPLNVSLTLNRFVNVTCSVFNIAAEESILKLDIYIFFQNTIALRFFINQLTGFFVPLHNLCS